MNKAEQLMAVEGLIYGLTQIKARLRGEVLELKAQVGASQFRTALGPVSVATPKAKPVITDERKFLAWVSDNYPDEIEQKVRESFTKALLAKVRMVGADVLTPEGEVLEFASVDEGGDEYVSARLTAEVKEQAATQVAEALERMIGIVQIEAGQ